MFVQKLIDGGKLDAALFSARDYLCATDSGHAALVVFGMSANRPNKNSNIDSNFIRLKSKFTSLLVPKLYS